MAHFRSRVYTNLALHFNECEVFSRNLSAHFVPEMHCCRVVHHINTLRPDTPVPLWLDIGLFVSKIYQCPNITIRYFQSTPDLVLSEAIGFRA